jgi:hypothetical protein
MLNFLHELIYSQASILLSTGYTINFVKSSENKASYVPMARREVPEDAAPKFTIRCSLLASHHSLLPLAFRFSRRRLSLFFFPGAVIFCNLPS